MSAPYFKGLDSLRAIAALVVVIGHLDLISAKYQEFSIRDFTQGILPNGHLGVILFFVLSGFLITYLLVKEKQRNGRISYRKFYMRRIFRIWPLYYLILLLSALILSGIPQFWTATLCLSIFPNVAHALGIGWQWSPQVWSIGVEEQFYLFWPVLLMSIPRKWVLAVLSLFFVGYSLLPHFIGFVGVRLMEDPTALDTVNHLFYGTKFNCMCLGGILGYLCATESTVHRVLYHPVVAYGTSALTLILWCTGFQMNHFTDEFFAILFGIVILNVATNPDFRWNFSDSILNPLGKISYGIYMYHWIVIEVMMKTLPYQSIASPPLRIALFYAVGIAVTIGISWLSYNTFERYFLRIKDRYQS